MKYRKVIMWDKSFVIIKAEQEPPIATAKRTGKPFYLNHLSGRDFVEPGAIARITDAKHGDYHIDPPANQKLLAQPEISDEQRAANVAKIAKMKQEHIERMERRRSGQQRSSAANRRSRPARG